MTDQVLSSHGKLTILVASGGAADSAPALFSDLPDDAFNAVSSSQFLNRFSSVRAALPHLGVQGGSAIIVGTDAGRFPTEGKASHGGMGATKITLSKTLARQFSRWNIGAGIFSLMDWR